MMLAFMGIGGVVTYISCMAYGMISGSTKKWWVITAVSGWTIYGIAMAIAIHNSR
jgi:hypothetical protein